jgi:plasmid maintenance system antidote protein VapI
MSKDIFENKDNLLEIDFSKSKRPDFAHSGFTEISRGQNAPELTTTHLHFGEFLQGILIDMNMNSLGFAVSLNMPMGTINSYLAGRSRVEPWVLLKIEKLTQIPAVTLAHHQATLEINAEIKKEIARLQAAIKEIEKE